MMSGIVTAVLLVVWAVVVAGGAVLLLGLRVVLRRGKTA